MDKPAARPSPDDAPERGDPEPADEVAPCACAARDEGAIPGPCYCNDRPRGPDSPAKRFKRLSLSEQEQAPEMAREQHVPLHVGEDEDEYKDEPSSSSEEEDDDSSEGELKDEDECGANPAHDSCSLDAAILSMADDMSAEIDVPDERLGELALAPHAHEAEQQEQGSAK
jgi:hypothetical protein